MQPLRQHTHLNGRMNEIVVLNGLKDGSREALAMLWQEHSSHVLNLAFRMLKDRDQAEDILMDVFVQVPAAVQKFRGDSALGTWLYRLTVNACLMKLRAERRHAELEEQNWEAIVKEALGAELDSPSKRFFASVAMEQIIPIRIHTEEDSEASATETPATSNESAETSKASTKKSDGSSLAHIWHSISSSAFRNGFALHLQAGFRI